MKLIFSGYRNRKNVSLGKTLKRYFFFIKAMLWDSYNSRIYWE